MVTEYLILNLKSKNLNPDFYCFGNPLDTKNKISKVFLIDNCKWTESKSTNGICLQAFYETELAYIKIEILKPKMEFPYIFQLTVLGGTHPLYEVARLCKLNSWKAYDGKTSKYLNLENQPKLEINDSKKKSIMMITGLSLMLYKKSIS